MRKSFLPFLLALPLLTQCLFDNRQAGTSTSVTNPVGLITGFAILKDGTPAAGARVRLRLPAVEAPGGTPRAALFSDTVADSTGKFTVPLVYMKDAYLEIREAPGQRPGRPADSLEIQLRRWPNGLPHDGKMGTLRLAPPGEISGRLETPAPEGPYHRWVGVRGSDIFVEAQGKDPFVLKGVGEGRRELMVVAVPDSAALPGRAPVVADSVVEAVVQSGRNSDFGAIFYTND